eukprot:TRINITY_DN38011_c0_g1_i1.p1 TRINITY_DN38011_c0_g1~~TRINITY_DN38011_c0_g1_i1.p1  ORF type:complete len:127 (-),score=28.11 TRINITY_DN38011_c0_g1_i1:115-495(-)
MRTQPLMPQASWMRPSSTASAGRADATRAADMARSGGRGGGLGFLDQARDRVGRGGTHADPVIQAVAGDAQLLFAAFGVGVVETQAFDEVAIAARTLVGGDDGVERTCLGTAARESNDDHDLSLGG